jgi:hypothetical protein
MMDEIGTMDVIRITRNYMKSKLEVLDTIFRDHELESNASKQPA